MNKKVKIHILILFSLIVFMKNIFAEQVTEVSDQEFFDDGIALFQSRQLESAIAIFDKLSKKDYSPALFYLGKIYYHGDGLNKNIPLALTYFEKASLKGHKPSKFMLGLFFAEKCYDLESCARANQYLEQAAQL